MQLDHFNPLNVAGVVNEHSIMRKLMLSAGTQNFYHQDGKVEVVRLRDLSSAVARENHRFHRELGPFKSGTIQALVYDFRKAGGRTPVFVLTNECLSSLLKEAGAYADIVKVEPGVSAHDMEQVAEYLQLPETPDGFMIPPDGLLFHYNGKIEAGAYECGGNLLWYANPWHTVEGYKIRPVKVTCFA